MASPSGHPRRASACDARLMMIIYRQLHHLMIVEWGFAYTKLCWCSQAIIKSAGGIPFQKERGNG